MKQIKLYTYLFGDNFKYVFENFCYPSLEQSVERLKAKGVAVQWDVFADRPIESCPQCTIHGAVANNTFENFQYYLAQNADAGVPVMMASPDFIFADTTLENCLELIDPEKDGGIAVAHPRISWESFTCDHLGGQWTARGLVETAFSYAHRCLYGADRERVQNLTWTGLSFKYLGNMSWAVTHNLATPLICTFNQSDVEYFKGKHFGHFDRGFTKKLLSEGRIKLVGSSDIAFFVELTPKDHAPEICEVHEGVTMLGNDKESAGENHYNQFIVNWRA